MSRGINRAAIFLEDRDRDHFLDLLEKAAERFRIRIHAYVLMDNHFHLLVETPEGNLSASMQWLKQAYSIWHNLKHDRVGPLFQGRFKSVPVEDASWAYELSLYLHLNPLRLARFKLSRVERLTAAVVMEKEPTAKEATRLLRALRLFPWSSYHAYAGHVRKPAWLTTETILIRAGGRDAKQSYRKEVQRRLTSGVEGESMERLRDAIAVGSAAFSEKVRKVLRQSDREFAGRYQARKAATLPSVIKAVERHVGTPVVLGKRGGLGRDMALKLARDLCGLTLRELGAQMGGVDYASVHMAIRRLEQKMAKQSDLRKTMDRLKAGLLIV
jgi:putative transposase